MSTDFTIRACSQCGTVIDHDPTGGAPEHLCAARQRELLRAELAAPPCDHDGCRAGAVLVTSHGRRLCGNSAHIAAADGEGLIWQVGTGRRPPAEWWLR